MSLQEDRWKVVKERRLQELIDVAVMELLAIRAKEQMLNKKLIH